MELKARVTRKGIWVVRRVEALERAGVPTPDAWATAVQDARERQEVGALDPDDLRWTEPMDGVA